MSTSGSGHPRGVVGVNNDACRTSPEFVSPPVAAWHDLSNDLDQSARTAPCTLAHHGRSTILQFQYPKPHRIPPHHAHLHLAVLGQVLQEDRKIVAAGDAERA